MNHGIHKSNFGLFGDQLPCDLDGYTYTTQQGWMNANMDAMTWCGYSAREKRDECTRMAREARAALALAHHALDGWRNSNR